MRKFPEPMQQTDRVASRRAAVARALVLTTGLGLLSFVATGCAGTTEKLANLPPSLGGLPADTPARPVNDQASYPAVHDMPPARATPTLTPEQVKAVETEIDFARTRQKAQAKAPGAGTSETEER